MDKYAVFGNPVAHSLSPRIHKLFADQTGQVMTYERIEAPLGGFADTVADFLGGGGLGCNVTLPFKGDAANWVDSLDQQAAFAQAVNTIAPSESGGYRGFNTDGPGLVNDLQRLLGNATELRVLLIGAGGAASGVARPLLSLAGELVIANRTEVKADALAARLGQDGAANVSGVGLAKIAGRFDLVINATSAGLDDQVPDIAPTVVEGACCYDMVYGGLTAFQHWADASGASESHGGLGMLVEQAALAFELWRGVLPETERVRKALEVDG